MIPQGKSFVMSLAVVGSFQTEVERRRGPRRDGAAVFSQAALFSGGCTLLSFHRSVLTLALAL